MGARAGRSERDRNPARLNLRLSYTQALQEAGAIAGRAPRARLHRRRAPLLDRLDGLLFSGGPDLDPATYGAGAPPAARAGRRPRRRRVRARAAGEATARDLPLLAICRGMQALNVARGGTLHQHLPDRTQLQHRQRTSPTSPRTRSRPRRLAAAPPDRPAPARRQQLPPPGRRRARDRLEVVAHAPDGTIEALYDPPLRFCLGVQWHAELLTHRAEHAPLVTALIEAASRPALRLVA